MSSNNSFYTILPVNSSKRGLISLVTTVMNHVIYALQKNLIPVVDMKNAENIYFKDGRKHEDNAWEYYFQQPCNYDLNDVKNSDNERIVAEPVHIIGKYSVGNLDIFANDKISEKEKQIISEIRKYYKKYLRFSPEMLTYAEQKYNDISKILKKENNAELLGILCRGTDYLDLKPYGHPIQPKVKDVIKHAKAIINKNPNIKYIYLATEDSNIYKQFKDEFRDMLLENNQYMYTLKKEEKNKLLAEIDTPQQNHHYNLGKDYLTSLYILTKANYFIGGRCSGSIFVWLMAEHFKYSYIYNLGYYGIGKLQNIFSITNIRGEKRIAVSILGIKIKFKNILSKE